MERDTGIRIVALLNEYGMSQRELAAKTNLTEAAVSRYVGGSRVPKGAVLLNIAHALGTTTEYLSGKSDTAHVFTARQELDTAFKLIARNVRTLNAADKERFARLLFS